MNEEARVISPDDTTEDLVAEINLRPRTMDEYIGQPVMREKLGIFLEAAKRRNDVLDHALIFGPPGLGKTTLAHVIAHEMGVSLRQTSGPVLERAGDLAALLTNLQPGDVLFVAGEPMKFDDPSYKNYVAAYNGELGGAVVSRIGNRR